MSNNRIGWTFNIHDIHDSLAVLAEVISPDKNRMWRLACLVCLCLVDPVMRWAFKVGTVTVMTRSLAQRACWRRVVGETEERLLSLLGDVFWVSTQQDITDSHCQHVPLMFLVSKKKHHNTPPTECSFYFIWASSFHRFLTEQTNHRSCSE